MQRSKYWFRDLSLACATGGLLTLTFPKFSLDWLAWVALLPLLSVRPCKMRAFLCAHLAGIVFMSGLFSWIWTVKAYNWTDYALLQIFYLPLFLSLWGLGVAWIREATGIPLVLVAPPLWVTVENLRSHLSFLSFPWMLLGASQAQHPWLIQIVSLTGVYGLSFLIVFVNSALSDVVTYQGRLAKGWRYMLRRNAQAVASLAAAGLLVTGTVTYGVLSIPTEENDNRISVLIAQGNIPLEEGGNPANRLAILEKHRRLTASPVDDRPRLIIWPESAVIGDPTRDAVLRHSVAAAAQLSNAWLLVGSSVREKFPDRVEQAVEEYNTMLLFSPQGEITGQYRKMVLVPFGEYEPLRGYFHWPEAVAAQFGHTQPGKEYTVFRVGNMSFATVVCWETIFPDHVREFVKRGAQFIVSATNEAWFGDTAAPYEMLMMAVFRAVENHVAIARAANTGLSALIDPYGRIIKIIEGVNGRDIFIEGTLTEHITLSRGGTFYTRYGDIFAYTQLFIVFGLALQASWIHLNVSLPLMSRKDRTIGWRFDR